MIKSSRRVSFWHLFEPNAVGTNPGSSKGNHRKWHCPGEKWIQSHPKTSALILLIAAVSGIFLFLWIDSMMGNSMSPFGPGVPWFGK